jgi:hypothetical protein
VIWDLAAIVGVVALAAGVMAWWSLRFNGDRVKDLI